MSIGTAIRCDDLHLESLLVRQVCGVMIIASGEWMPVLEQEIPTMVGARSGDPIDGAPACRECEVVDAGTGPFELIRHKIR